MIQLSLTLFGYLILPSCTELVFFALRLSGVKMHGDSEKIFLSICSSDQSKMLISRHNLMKIPVKPRMFDMHLRFSLISDGFKKAKRTFAHEAPLMRSRSFSHFLFIFLVNATKISALIHCFYSKQ